MRSSIKKTAAIVMAVSTLMTGVFGMADVGEAFAAVKVSLKEITLSKKSAAVKVPLKKITLNKKSAKVQAGKSFRLMVSYTPIYTTVKKKVKWTSSKKSVAVVKKGKVIAKKPGKTTITAKVGNKKAKCKVIVTKKPLKSVPVQIMPIDEKTDEKQDEGQKESDQSDNGMTDTENDYVDPAEAYDALNAFRTTPNVWIWNEDNTTKTYYNTHDMSTLKELQRDEALEQNNRTLDGNRL